MGKDGLPSCACVVLLSGESLSRIEAFAFSGASMRFRPQKEAGYLPRA